MGRRTLLLIGAAIVLAVAIAWMVRDDHGPVGPVVTTPGPAASMQAGAPTSCLRPGPAPVLPDGAAASEAEMRAAHDRIQGFVKQLEAFQACRIAQADKAAQAVTAQQKKTWLDDGDSAVDEANALARAFSAQIVRYKAGHPAP